MAEIITFIIRLFTAAFYTLVFLGVLAVDIVIVTIHEWNEKEKEDKK